MKKQINIYTMFIMNEKNFSFKCYPEARYATDVIFQRSKGPCVNVWENHHYYGVKHHLYGLKTEVLVF